MLETLDERELHKRRADETYRDLEPNTRKAFGNSCRQWVVFCTEKTCSRFGTTAKKGAEFPHFERERLSHPGKNVEIYLNQFKKLCKIRGVRTSAQLRRSTCISVVTTDRTDSAIAARSHLVKENNKRMDRSFISSADLHKLLRVCADMPDRFATARATALINTSRLTSESAKVNAAVLCLYTLLAALFEMSPETSLLLLQM